MRYYTDLDGKQHFIDARPSKNTIDRYIPEPIQRLLKFGLSMAELTQNLIHFRYGTRSGKVDESSVSSSYNYWFKMGLIHWGEGTKIYLTNW